MTTLMERKHSFVYNPRPRPPPPPKSRLLPMSVIANLPPDRKALFSRLMRQSKAFNDASKPRKLLSNPYKFILSEASVRSRRLVDTQARTFWDDSMFVCLPEPVSTFLYRYGYFEEGLTAFFIAVLREGDCFMDVGSHFGYFSMLARHLIGASGRIVAFEPTPSTFQRNRRNTGRFDNIHVENRAAWSVPKTITLTDLGVAWSSHNSLIKPKMVPNGMKTESRTHEVDCVKLDDYIEQHGIRANLIKIDAESAELEILKGLSNTLRSSRPMITLEVGDDPAANSGVKSADAVSYCATFDYVPFIYADGEIRRHEIQDVYEYDNVFMVPSEKVHAILRI